MSKILKYGLMFLIFLDVAIFPFACQGSNPDRNRVFIHIMYENEEEGALMYYYDLLKVSGGYTQFDDFKVGDTITEDQVKTFIDTNKKEDVGYTIVKYQIKTHDARYYKDITLPYTIKSDDTLNYLYGMRGAAHLVVVVKINGMENNGE